MKFYGQSRKDRLERRYLIYETTKAKKHSHIEDQTRGTSG